MTERLPIYHYHAPFNTETHVWINEDRITEPQKARALAIEICDGGGGRCKCPVRCVRYILRRGDAQ